MIYFFLLKHFKLKSKNKKYIYVKAAELYSYLTC